MKIKITSLILLLAMIFTFSACAANKTVMKYETAELSERIYSYWLHQYKSYFMNSAGDMTDDDEFWNSKVNDGSDMTMEQYFTDLADINIKKNLVSMKLFDEYGLTIPDETYARIDSEILDAIDSYGNVNEFNKMLADYGINDKIYRDIYIIQEKIGMLFEHMFGAESGRIITDEEIDMYFVNNYMRIKYITINLYDINEDGTLKVIDADERSRRFTQAEYIYSDIKNNGADFDTMFKSYTYDPLEGYENGVYFSSKNRGAHPVINETLDVVIDDVVLVEDEYVAYIVKKLPLEDKPYMSENIDKVQFTDLYTACAEELFQNILFECIDEIEVIDNIKKNYTIRMD